MYRLYVITFKTQFIPHILISENEQFNTVTLYKVKSFCKKNHNYTCKTAYSVHVHCNNF